MTQPVQLSHEDYDMYVAARVERDALAARLAEAERLIDELCDHEGAEGWSEDLRRDLDNFHAGRATDSATVGCEGEDGLLRIHPASETCEICATETANEGR